MRIVLECERYYLKFIGKFSAVLSIVLRFKTKFSLQDLKDNVYICGMVTHYSSFYGI